MSIKTHSLFFAKRSGAVAPGCSNGDNVVAQEKNNSGSKQHKDFLDGISRSLSSFALAPVDQKKRDAATELSKHLQKVTNDISNIESCKAPAADSNISPDSSQQNISMLPQ